MRYYLGVDGGGTKTEAVVTDERGVLVLVQDGRGRERRHAAVRQRL